jgi:Kef-type K+ transport system membrane component KefB
MPLPRSTDAIAAIVFIDMAVIIVVARLMRGVMKRVGQPPVVGEVIAGILLGPSLLGIFPGNLPGHLFPLDVQPYLAVVAQLGLIMFMFTVGLELDTKLVQGRLRVVSLVSVSSIALPFGLGIIVATVIYRSHRLVTLGSSRHVVHLVPFALFLGVSLSVTAFPLLARILTERGMHKTPIGALALACGAVDDILAWSILAVVLGIVASTGVASLGLLVGESVAFVAVMFGVVKPRLRRLADRYRELGRVTPDMMAVVLVGFLACSYVTSKIGIHAIFGAFLFGVVMPRQETRELFHAILARLEQVSVLLLLPVFFVVTGLDTNVRTLGRSALTQLPLIVVVAVIGKFAGATLAARAQGIPLRQAAAIGTLMDTRGLTGLVILNVGLDAGILDTHLFTMLVVMAVLTTLMTGPVLRLVYPERDVVRDIAEAERAALGVIDAYRVIVLVEECNDPLPLLDLAAGLVATEQPSEIVLSRLSPAPRSLELGTGLGAGLGQMVASLDELRVLGSRLDDRGVAYTVRSQFSEDLARDLLAQAVAVEADVVLVGVDGGDPARALSPARLACLSRLAAEGPCLTGLVAGGSGDAVGALPSRALVVRTGAARTHDLAALELALRLGAAWETDVVVADEGKRTRTVARWVERAGRAGWRCRMSDAPADGAGPGPAPMVVASILAGSRNRLVDAAALAGALASVTAMPGVPNLVVSDGGGRAERNLQRLLERRAGACDRTAPTTVVPGPQTTSEPDVPGASPTIGPLTT